MKRTITTILILYLDFSNVFDTVLHQRLNKRIKFRDGFGCGLVPSGKEFKFMAGTKNWGCVTCGVP